MLQEIKEIVAEILELEVAAVGDDTDLVEELGMDSVLAIDITTSVERRFKVRVPEERLAEFTSVRAIADVVASLGGAKEAAR